MFVWLWWKTKLRLSFLSELRDLCTPLRGQKQLKKYLVQPKHLDLLWNCWSCKTRLDFLCFIRVRNVWQTCGSPPQIARWEIKYFHCLFILNEAVRFNWICKQTFDILRRAPLVEWREGCRTYQKKKKKEIAT